MKKKVSIFFISLSIAIFMAIHSFAEAPMSTYCVSPPFLKSNSPSNLVFILDYSGSMSWSAYFPKNAENPMNYYDKTKTYYGYFIPNKLYEKGDNDVWKFSDSSEDCSVSCEEAENSSGYYVTICQADGVCSGNVLNFIYMARVDILRWILTGGKVVGNYCTQRQTCDDFNLWQCKQDNYHDNMCTIYNWFFMTWCGNAKKCSDFTSESECEADNYHDNMCAWVNAKYVETGNGVKIKIEDVSTYNPSDGKIEGLLQSLQRNPQRPRVATIMFGSEVYGYTAFSSNYAKAVQEINKVSPYGGTATKDAVGVIDSLFKENGYYTYYFGDPYKFGGKIVPCVKNFAILISDGEWNEPDTSEDSDPVPVIDEMWKGGNADLVRDIIGKQKVETFSIAAFMNSSRGENALKWMAVYGNYRDLNGDGKPCDVGDYPDTSLTVTENLESSCTSGEVVPNESNTGPYGYFRGDNPSGLRSAISSAINEVIKKVSSSTAASVVSTNEKSGANILQAVFWVRRYFDSGTSATWIGSLYNLWLYLGYYADSQEIRENSDTSGESNSTKYLTLKDKVIKFYNDGGTVKVEVCDDQNGNGNLTNCVKGYSIENIKTIWNAGVELWKTPPSSRYIFTDLPCPALQNEGNFVVSNASCLEKYMGVDNLTLAEDIIKWVRGNHVTGFRNRVVTIAGVSHVWKLGDIVDSTPKIVSIAPINSYYSKYGDKTYYDYNYYGNGNNRHSNRGMVFVGANDGMLHAFRLGSLSYPGGNILAELKTNGGPFGSEAWSFIPKNALPYLQYLVRNDYCHIYTVDLTPIIIDASVGGAPSGTKTAGSWRTVLIGGMNMGGATGTDNNSAVHPPVEGMGYSSYFAIDITDTEHPRVLWDFTDDDMGFATSGVDIVHIPYNGDNTKNGYWYAVFASGPDNYDGTAHRPLYLYVLDLYRGNLVAKIKLSGNNSIIHADNVFSGRLFMSSIDLGRNYSDDAIYFGYTYQDSSGEWRGGILRINTKDDPNPNNWVASVLIDGIGPVTASVVPVEDIKNNALWVIFGTGRYFYKGDDPSSQRRIFGIKDPCYSNGKLINSCTETVSMDTLKNVTKEPQATLSSSDGGWYINLQKANNGYEAERVITDPSVLSTGNVVFATFMPSSDICKGGGNSYVWLLRYNNGGRSSMLNGKIFIQSSTGEIAEINEKSAFVPTSSNYGGRRSSTPIQGSPPLSGGLTTVITPKAVTKSIFWYEQ